MQFQKSSLFFSPVGFFREKFIVLLILFSFVLCYGCQSDQSAPSENFINLQGKTMGTYYNVTYGDAENRNFQTSIDSLLEALNNEVSTYIPSSVISTFNQSDNGIVLANEEKSYDHFIKNLQVASEIYRLSDGAFDPTINPLVNYWGFGAEERAPVTAVDSMLVDSLKAFVGFDKVKLEERDNNVVFLSKSNPGVQLDFSAIAKGYGVDAVGQLLESRGVNDYLVEIGGEVVARGVNKNGETWSIGVNQPSETSRLTDFAAVLPLDNKGMATSGNYRNFYEVNGVKYSHTINPKTGFPERNDLLSATIIAENCMYADAMATACMVMGAEAAFNWVSDIQDVEAYFIYGKADGTMGDRYTAGLGE